MERLLKESNETPYLMLYYKTNCRACEAVKKPFNRFCELLNLAKDINKSEEGKKSYLKTKMDQVHYAGDISFANHLKPFRMNIINESSEFSSPNSAPMFYFFKVFPDGISESRLFSLAANKVNPFDQDRVTRVLFEQSEQYLSF